MSAPGEWRGPAAQLGPGQSVTFVLQCGGRAVAGFLVNHDGEHHAYVNRCAHAGTPLDTWPNEFFSEDGRFLICSTHGAVFEPTSGVCVEGPCPGAALARLPVARHGDLLVVTCP